jgi:hypothetical protein
MPPCSPAAPMECVERGIEPRSTEPKVRGSNPLGRASSLCSLRAFAGVRSEGGKRFVRRSEARERFWPIFWRLFWRRGDRERVGPVCSGPPDGERITRSHVQGDRDGHRAWGSRMPVRRRVRVARCRAGDVAAAPSEARPRKSGTVWKMQLEPGTVCEHNGRDRLQNLAPQNCCPSPPT